MAPSLTHIGSYKLLESMGRGGLGVLYRGVDEQFEEREVTSLQSTHRVRKPLVRKEHVVKLALIDLLQT